MGTALALAAATAAANVLVAGIPGIGAAPNFAPATGGATPPPTAEYFAPGAGATPPKALATGAGTMEPGGAMPPPTLGIGALGPPGVGATDPGVGAMEAAAAALAPTKLEAATLAPTLCAIPIGATEPGGAMPARAPGARGAAEPGGAMPPEVGAMPTGAIGATVWDIATSRPEPKAAATDAKMLPTFAPPGVEALASKESSSACEWGGGARTLEVAAPARAATEPPPPGGAMLRVVEAAAAEAPPPEASGCKAPENSACIAANSLSLLAAAPACGRSAVLERPSLMALRGEPVSKEALPEEGEPGPVIEVMPPRRCIAAPPAALPPPAVAATAPAAPLF